MTLSNISTGACFKIADDVIVQPAGDEALLVKLNAENVFGLNATGIDIVLKLSSGVPLEAAIDDLAAAYEGDRDAIARDVRALIDVLLGRGLLEVVAR